MILAIPCILLALAQNLNGLLESACPKILVIDKEKSVGKRWYGQIILSTQVNIRGVSLELEFDKSIVQLANWLGSVTSDDDNIQFSIKNDDQEIGAGQSYNVRFFVIYETNNDLEPPRLVKIRFNGKEICFVDSNERCGVTNYTSSGLLTAGLRPEPGEYPWHATLYQKEGKGKKFLCNASLISKQHVITPAHCTTLVDQSRNPEDLVIILGKYGFWIDGKHEQTFQGKDIFVHENYNRSNFYNDISVIKLDAPIEYTKFVRPICLWGEDTSLDIVLNRTGKSVGWAREHESNRPNDLLIRANLPVIDYLSCIFIYPEYYSVSLNPDKSNFCVGYTNGSAYCPFSGSALAFPTPTSTGSNIVWQLRGFASNTVPTKNGCSTKYYVIFTDVAKYSDWIAQKLEL